MCLCVLMINYIYDGWNVNNIVNIYLVIKIGCILCCRVDSQRKRGIVNVSV